MKSVELLLAALIGMVGSNSVGAEQPHLVNARVEARSGAGLEEQLRALANEQVQPAWAGYAVRAVAGHHHLCCSGYTNHHIPSILQPGGCKLEGPNDGMNFQLNDDEGLAGGSSNIVVLFRLADKAVGKIRVFSDDCELDAGGLTMFWLTNVAPTQSIDLLSSFVPLTEESFREVRHKSETAVSAIALHADPAAEKVLEGFMDPKQPEIVRRNVAFWLGSARGQKGYEILRRVMQTDSSDKMREQCVFALSVSKVPEAINLMIETAQNDKSVKVRGQAMFWLARKAGTRVVETLANAITQDPEFYVKKKAVFALSQLPKDEGVPKLIEISRTNKNPDLRKEAMFWLGQSKDPRALAFFEEVLAR
jgi:hypothetical protein